MCKNKNHILFKKKITMQHLETDRDKKHLHILESLRSETIIKIKRKKLTEDYNYFSLIFRT